MEIKPRHLFYI